jgi:hypothetical protein
MLLQWPDLYYHTSQDTIDKVSASTLKRIGWIVAVAALTLANADVEEAYTLMTMTYANGITRLQAALKEAVQNLLRTKNNSKHKANPQKTRGHPSKSSLATQKQNRTHNPKRETGNQINRKN